MLQAELHGKLALDDERAEDVLTSSVWGTLTLVGAWHVIRAWLGRARDNCDRMLQLQGHESCAAWFWPRLGEIEPDLVLSIGAMLVVVEAKYLSGKSGEGMREEVVHDQLARQWRAVTQPSHCDPQLREAIEGSGARALVYLVRAADREKARKGVVASQAYLDDESDIYLLTWEDLHELLAERRAGDEPWRSELRRLLERRGLRSFRGFQRLGTVAAVQQVDRALGSLRRLTPAPAALALRMVEHREGLELARRIEPRLLQLWQEELEAGRVTVSRSGR